MSQYHNTDGYYDTLGDVRDAVTSRLALDGYVTAEPVSLDRALNYGQSDAWDFALVTHKNKPTRKWAHVRVFRCETGRYELTFYVL